MRNTTRVIALVATVEERVVLTGWSIVLRYFVIPSPDFLGSNLCETHKHTMRLSSFAGIYYVVA